jgi:hypothetical protein
MLFKIINTDKNDNNSKDYTFLGNHVKQLQLEKRDSQIIERQNV